MEHTYTITFYPYGRDVDAGIVKLSPSTQYGYWEFSDGSEGGGLWFEGTELVDFDGHYFLPARVVKVLRDNGYTLDDSFD
jgi:hypothetical protein